jgi:hypothetical protein
MRCRKCKQELGKEFYPEITLTMAGMEIDECLICIGGLDISKAIKTKPNEKVKTGTTECQR